MTEKIGKLLIANLLIASLTIGCSIKESVSATDAPEREKAAPIAHESPSAATVKNPAETNAECNVSLLQAVRNDNITDVKFHLGHGWKNFDTKDLNTGETPLIIAAKKKNSQMVALFLDEGCNVETADNEGYTALIYCINGSWTAGVQTLLEKRPTASIDYHVGMTQDTPLHAAVKQQDIQMVELLLKHEPNIQAMNAKGWTAFMLAVEGGDPALIYAFHAVSGFDVTKEGIKGTDGIPPLLWAIKERANLSVIEVILQMPNAIYSVDRNGRDADEYLNAFWTQENAAKARLKQLLEEAKAKADFGF
jgi:cytohesin